jgi:hypothetical protein
MIAQVHDGEMILPKAQADQVRSGNAGGVFGRSGGGAGVNVTHAPVINAIDGASVARFYRNNEKQLLRQINDAARRGANLGMSKLS